MFVLITYTTRASYRTLFKNSTHPRSSVSLSDEVFVRLPIPYPLASRSFTVPFFDSRKSVQCANIGVLDLNLIDCGMLFGMSSVRLNRLFIRAHRP